MDRKLKRKLEKQQKFFEDILSGMKDWVRVIDHKNCVLFMNEPMKKHVGNTVGEECFRALGKKEPCENCITKRAIFEGNSITKEEWVDGRIYSVVSSPIRGENNNIDCAVEVFRDVTEHRAMESLILAQNEKMKRDLDFAKKLQKKILPENKIYNGCLKIASEYIPCEILGGDVYDVIQIDEENIGLYMADVSGHGVTSSMMTMFIRQTLKNVGQGAMDPAETLRYLYHRYRELNIDDQHYITIFYGVYNKRNKNFTYSNAGHNCMPILIHKNEIKELKISGLPICTIFEDVAYDKKEIPLHVGDKILFYTDGITESHNEEEGFFQNDRVLEFCRKNGQKEVEEIIDGIIREANDFSKGKIKDDIALMGGEVI